MTQSWLHGLWTDEPIKILQITIIMDQSLSPAQLQDLLHDTQESLAASFARIEAYRLQNRQLRSELAQLRAQVHGSDERTVIESSKDASALETCSLKFPQQRNVGSHPIVICDGSNKVASLLFVRIPDR